MRQSDAKPSWREMNHRAAPAVLATLAFAMASDQTDVLHPFTRRERLFELFAVVVLVYLTIAIMAA